MVPLPSVHLALLICDEPVDKPVAGIFRRWLQDAYPSNGEPPSLCMKAYDVREGKEEYPTSEELEKINAVMLTGSRADAFEDEPWILHLLCFTQEIYNRYTHIRMFGICFGHQIIARAFGGKSERIGKWEFGLAPIRLTGFGQRILGVDHFFEVQQIHQDQVPLETLSDHLSSGTIYLLGSSPETANQGFVQLYEHCRECELGIAHEIHRHIHIMTLQGHPELPKEVADELIDNKELQDQEAAAYYDEIPPASPIQLEEAGEQTLWPHAYGGIKLIGKAFWKVFGVQYADRIDHDYIPSPLRGD